MAGSTGSATTDRKCRERQGTLFPKSRYERPVNRDLNKVIGNMQCGRLDEEGLILSSRIPAHCKATDKQVLRPLKDGPTMIRK